MAAPGPIHSQRIWKRRTEFGATFNQADLVSNRLVSAHQTFRAERRQELLTERDGLRRESLGLAGDFEGLETEKASTEDKDEVITFEAATEDEPSATLVVKITGTGFTDNLKGSVGGKAIEVAVKSATEAILTLENPKAARVVTLEDEVTKQKVKVVVTRKKSKERSETSAFVSHPQMIADQLLFQSEATKDERSSKVRWQMTLANSAG